MSRLLELAQKLCLNERSFSLLTYIHNIWLERFEEL
jgi:hypothetical protein